MLTHLLEDATRARCEIGIEPRTAIGKTSSTKTFLRGDSDVKKIVQAPGRLVLALLFVLILLPAKAHATAVTAVLSCDPCTTVTDMLDAANSAYTTLPNQSIALMTSLNEPVSAYLKLSCSPPGKGGGCEWVLITATNADAAALDNQTFARAAKLTPVVTPSTITYGEVDEVIIQYIQTQLVQDGPTGINAWHLLTGGFPNVQWFQVTDIQTGQVVDLYIGDTITVQYPGGYSEQWQFISGTDTVKWKRVPNTLMLNGKPVTPPSTTPGTPAPGHGSMIGTDGYTPGTVSAASSINYCYGVSTTTVTSGGVSSTYYGLYIFPC
jgi:hypothetical protein